MRVRVQAEQDVSAADDTPAEGELANGCGKQYDRDYDYKGMAEALDFLVVMDCKGLTLPRFVALCVSLTKHHPFFRRLEFLPTRRQEGGARRGVRHVLFRE